MEGAINFSFRTRCVLLQFISIIITCVGGSTSCIQFEYSSPPRSSLSVQNAEYLCINGMNGTSIWAVWSDVELKAKAKKGQYVKFINGNSCEEVTEKHSQSSSWLPVLSAWFSATNTSGTTSVTVSPYGKNCFAVYDDGPEGSSFTLEVRVNKLNPWYPLVMITGMLIFCNADDISRNVLFYYTSGVSVGMILSILLLVFIISRLIPKRSVGYAVMVGGSSLVLYILQLAKYQIANKVYEHNKIIYGYFTVAGLISFLYCYYRGPIRSERGLDIVRWCLQTLALSLVYYSIRCEKISLTFVSILAGTKWISLRQLFCYIITRPWLPYRLQSFFLKPRLISVEEYEKEGRLETARALKELREYCKSPDCNTWQIVSRLKSPKRFASFISDEEHITLDEQLEYASTSFDAAPFLTSDEDSDLELEAMNSDFED